MKFERLLEIVGDAPIFETGLLLAGAVDSQQVRRQLSRWVAAGKIYRLRRGVYALAGPYQKTSPHPYYVAGRLVRASYVSLQSALAQYGLIPEYVPVVTSITTDRPQMFTTPLGHYTFRHIKPELFYGQQILALVENQQALIATPEKALLDQVYFQPGGDTLAYLRGLRLQHLESLDLQRLEQLARRANSPKLQRAALHIALLAHEEAEAGYEILSDAAY